MKYKVDKTKWDHTRILYKYGSAESVYKILEKITIKATRPDVFNDPFDTLTPIDFTFSLHDLRDALYNEIEILIFSEKEPVFIDNDQITEKILELRKIRHTLNRENIRLMCNIFFEPILQSLREMIKKDEEAWKQYLLTWRIVSLSRVKDNLLLWANYADKHRGAVIGFKCIPQIDSAFCAAIEVNYSRSKPTLGNIDEWVKHITNQIYKNIEECYMDMVFTKSIDWAYEEEYRYPLPAQNIDETSDYRTFDWREIGEVILGCRISKIDKVSITKLCRQRYPGIKIFQATQSKTDFTLILNELSN